MTTPDELVEIGARALCIAHGDEPDKSTTLGPADGPFVVAVAVPAWWNYRTDARAVLDAVLPRVREEERELTTTLAGDY